MSPPPDRRAGLTLLELLMTLGLAGIALASVVQFFALHTRKLQGHSFRVEAQQALRSSLDAMVRDVRLAGACLPVTGAYIAVAGTDAAGAPGDSITIRTGVVRANMSCVVASLTVLMAQGSNQAQVDSSNGFTVNELVYIRHPSGSGQFLFINAVAGNTVTLGSNASVDYPVGSGLYVIDERTYAVDTSIPNNPRLMLTVNRGAAEAFAAGISNLQIQYILNQNCPPCDVVNAPLATDTATWRLVNDVLLTATAQTVGTIRAEDVATLTETSRAKPRNLLP